MIFRRPTERGRALVDLAIAFVQGAISADEFEARFLAGRQAAPGRRFGRYDEVLSHIFISVDAYCGDPELRGSDDLDAAGLKQETGAFLSGAKLLQQWPSHQQLYCIGLRPNPAPLRDRGRCGGR